MQTGWNENRALLRGTAAGSPVFSHENHGVAYDLFPLSVQRLSGAADRLNVVLPRSLLTACPVYEGLPLEVQGEVRSFNNRSGSGSRLVITVLARELAPTAEKPANHLALAGALCKPPILRRTPLGREICDLMLAVNRRYGRADYLPCIAWGAVAQQAACLRTGQRFTAEGRVQSRIYTKNENGVLTDRTAYEVSIMRPAEVEEFLTLPTVNTVNT